MKTLIICVFIAICFIVKGTSEPIKCYECDDCNVLDDSQLKICPAPKSPNPPTSNNPSTPLPIESTMPTDESTSGTIPSTLETVSTTLSSTPTQIITDPPRTTETITETSKTESTTIKTEVTEPPITNETQPTTSSSSPGVEIPTIPQIPSQSPEMYGEITDEPEFPTSSSENNNPRNELPEAINPLQTESSRIPTGITDPVQEIPVSIVFNPIGSTNSPEILSPVTVGPETAGSINNLSPGIQVLPESFPSEEVNSFVQELMAQPPGYNQPYPIYNRVRREVGNARALPTSHCYSIDLLDGDKKKVKKGCIEIPEDKDASDVLKNEFGNSIQKWKVCAQDKCNSSSTLKLSVITLAMILVISFYWK